MVEVDLADALSRHAGRHAVPGAAIGLLCDGVVSRASYGIADLRTGRRVTDATRFRIGSLTKPMVATVIAWLAAAGRLGLRDPVAEHVPELQHSGWAQHATVLDLLANRSGLPLRSETEFGFAGRTDHGDDALSRLARDVAAASVQHEPTARPSWSYTNVGWCLLGRVIETVSDSVWPDAMRQFLAPVGLRHTSFETPGLDVPRVTGYQVTGRGVEPVVPTVSRAYGPAGTTTLSTVEDLLRFAAIHLGDPSLAPLRVRHSSVTIHGWLDAWCLGWAWFNWGSGGAWGWDGLLDGERCFLRFLPDRHAAVVLLSNSSAGRAMYRTLVPELMDRVFGLDVPPLPLTPSAGAAGDLSRYAGTYAWPDVRVRVVADRDALVLTDQDHERRALPIAEGVFLVDAMDPDNPTVTFGPEGSAGRPHLLYRMLWGLPRVDQ